MGAREDFLEWVNTELKDAEIAVHNGDADPRRAIWSQNEPATVFGAWKSAFGRPEVDQLFDRLEQTFTDCTSYEIEIIAAEVIGDMAYTVGYEHTQASVEGAAATYTLRVTHIFRREDGEWKLMHRHADRLVAI